MITLDENLPANAGDVDSIPGPGRSHMPRSNEVRVLQLLHPPFRAHEPQILKPPHLELCTTIRHATAMRHPSAARKCSPCSLQLEKAQAKQQRARAAKNKFFKNSIFQPNISKISFQCSVIRKFIKKIFYFF